MLRHKNLADKEIWDELKYWLQNPVTEKEQAQREQAETNFWDQKLTERFAKRKVNGVMTGAASSDGLYDAYRKVSEDKTLSPEEKVQRYQEVASTYNKRIEKEDVLKKAKLGTGALIALGSAAIPGGGVLGAKAAGAVAKPLAQFAGRKMAELTANTVVRGGAVGAVEGLGRGMLNDENPLKTAATDAVTGMALGGPLGAGAGNVEKVVRGNQLKKFGDIDQLASNVRKEYNTKVKKYYQDYVQGTSVNKNGKIDFTKRGVQEQLRWNPKQGQNFPELKNDIKTAKRMPNEPNRDILDKKDTDHFEVYRGKYGDHYIEHFKNNNRRYYITKDTPNSATHATSTDANRSATNIISKSMPKLKSPQEWLDNLRRQRGHMK